MIARILRLITLSTAFLASPVAAQDIVAEDVLEVGENPVISAQAGDLSLVHLWTTDPEGFLAAWGRETPPTLSSTLRTVRNVPIQQFILYANCEQDDEGHCHLRARVEITAHDGTPYADPMIFDALPKGAPVVERDHIGMAPVSIGIRVEDDEQIGTYTVELALTDVHAGTTARHAVEIEVSEAP